MTQAVELAPEEYRIRRGARKGLAGQLVVGAAIIALAMVIVGFVRADTRRLRTEIQPLRVQEAELLQWEAQVPILLENSKSWKVRGQQLHELTHQPYWCGVLEDMARSAGDKVRVDSLRIESQEVEEDEDGLTSLRYLLQIAGEAHTDIDVVTFLSVYSGSSHVKELRLEQFSATGVTGSGGVLFSMTGIVEPIEQP
jgi:hypothetical protein